MLSTLFSVVMEFCARNICVGEKVGRIEQEGLRKLEDKVRGEKADRRTDR